MSYGAQWKEYERRKALFLGSVFLSLALILLIGVPLAIWLDSGVPVFITAILCIAAVIGTANYRSNWKCPRCGKAYFWKWTGHNPFASKCVHCGLPKYAQSDLNGASEEMNDED